MALDTEAKAGSSRSSSDDNSNSQVSPDGQSPTGKKEQMCVTQAITCDDKKVLSEMKKCVPGTDCTKTKCCVEVAAEMNSFLDAKRNEAKAALGKVDKEAAKAALQKLTLPSSSLPDGKTIKFDSVTITTDGGVITLGEVETDATQEEINAPAVKCAMLAAIAPSVDCQVVVIKFAARRLEDSDDNARRLAKKKMTIQAMDDAELTALKAKQNCVADTTSSKCPSDHTLNNFGKCTSAACKKADFVAGICCAANQKCIDGFCAGADACLPKNSCGNDMTVKANTCKANFCKADEKDTCCQAKTTTSSTTTLGALLAFAVALLQ